ncbi:hypothetical protein PCANC_25063 [Puccinia coronata f. sp. avenae]|uniref:Uncharacterized protein n=1 Tax=Puccinia coronata f. sp. avenae TaxID=200324 RepID=A0A2N5TSQ2_9BASI|nr:hypothetical protein PCANC_28829 [Puccinia coronata f. sp. avenae]PLW28507.1 hypothetical protein PCANC_25063 [Puccinia coronata f. sp. avenae]
MLVSVSAPLSALHCVTLRYSAFSGKKEIFDAKSAGAQRSGRTFAPYARSVSADPRNCANTTLKAEKDLHPRALRAGSPGTSVREAYVKLAAQDGFDACQQYTLVAAEHLCTVAQGIAL